MFSIKRNSKKMKYIYKKKNDSHEPGNTIGGREKITRLICVK